MSKKLTLLTIAFFGVSICLADIDTTFMQEIQDKTSNANTKPEDLDRLMNRLRDTPTAPGTDYRNHINAYRLISDAYAKRNHFRQAYTTYLQYLELKEQLFQERMTSAIIAAQQSSSARQSKLIEEENATREEAADLLTSAERFNTSTFVYKKFFSLGIIVLTIIFAILLVRSGVRLLNMKKENESVRKDILQLHRIALAGKLIPGNSDGQLASIKSIKQSVMESANEISSLNSDVQLQTLTKSMEKTAQKL